jgi:hypothetical protein
MAWPQTQIIIVVITATATALYTQHVKCAITSENVLPTISRHCTGEEDNGMETNTGSGGLGINNDVQV